MNEILTAVDVSKNVALTRLMHNANSLLILNMKNDKNNIF